MKKIYIILSLLLISLSGCSQKDTNSVDAAINNSSMERKASSTTSITATIEDADVDILPEKEIPTTETDKTFNWVADATYDSGNISEEYTTSTGNTYYLKDIIVPYINIDSDDATKANNEIKAIYENALANYKQGIEDESTYVHICDYTSYKNGNIGSIIISLGIGSESTSKAHYSTYNFDLSTNKLLSYSELCDKLHYNNDTINKQLSDKIGIFISNFFEKDNIQEDTSLYIEKSINNYNEALNNETLQYFIDANSKLNIFVPIEYPTDTNQSEVQITLD